MEKQISRKEVIKYLDNEITCLETQRCSQCRFYGEHGCKATIGYSVEKWIAILKYCRSSLKTDEAYQLEYEGRDVKEVIHAKWLPSKFGKDWHMCSHCKTHDYYRTEYKGYKFDAVRKYCPFCGAKMGDPQESEEE